MPVSPSDTYIENAPSPQTATDANPFPMLASEFPANIEMNTIITIAMTKNENGAIAFGLNLENDGFLKTFLKSIFIVAGFFFPFILILWYISNYLSANKFIYLTYFVYIQLIQIFFNKFHHF